MQKIKILLVAALCSLLIASCDMYNSKNNTNTPQNADTNLGDDVKDIGDAVSDTAGDAVDNVKNGIDDLTDTDNAKK